MPDVRIEAMEPVVRGDGRRAYQRGVKLFLDGREVTDLTDVVLRAHVDDVVRLDCGVIPSAPITFVGTADVVIHLHALPGFRVVQSPRDDGSIIWRVEEEPTDA